MEANPGAAAEEEGDVVSNDGENESMPDLAIVADEDIEEVDSIVAEQVEDEEISSPNTPVLVQQETQEDYVDIANVENENVDEIVDEEEEEEENVEQQQIERDENDDETIERVEGDEQIDNEEEEEVEQIDNEEGGEGREGDEEEEVDSENGENPSEAQNNMESSNDDDDDEEEDREESVVDKKQERMIQHSDDNAQDGDNSNNKKLSNSELRMDIDDNDSKNSISNPEKIMTRKRSASISSSGGEDGPKRKQGRSASTEGKEQGTSNDEGLERTHDKYCWVCHKNGVYFNCKICPRSYHMRCICLPDYPEPTLPESDGTSKTCICPECVVVMNAENVDKRSEAMKMLSMDQLVSMLKYICGRMKMTPGVEPFLKPVQPSEACDYYDYIIYPMDIQTLEKNIKQRQYGSTEAFLADAQWLVHNSIIFNSSSSPYTASAKRILKVCKQELSEIETCPECYTNAHTKSETWFVEACKRPHILVWAKLKGFPFWPAKAMKIKDDQVDVRFFGQHDRAWVNMKDCYLYSEEMPASAPKKNSALLAAIDELNTHISKLSEAYGKVVLAQVKTPLGRELSLTEIQRLLPEFKPEEPSQQKTSAQVSGKSGKGMTITISSLKTNPTIVNNSIVESPSTSKVSNTKPKRTSTTTTSGGGNLNGNENSSSSSSSVSVTTRASKVCTNTTTTTTTNLEQSSIPLEVNETSSSSDLPDVEETTDKTSSTSLPPPTSSKSEESVKTDDEIPEKPITKESLDDDFESRVPSGEILASALGLKRITRRLSQTETTTVPINQRNEGDKIKSNYSHLQAQLRKSSQVSHPNNNNTTTNNLDLDQTQAGGVSIKEEPMDEGEIDNPIHANEEQEEKSHLDHGAVIGAIRNKAQDFMEQISTQAQTKPGYRFNISKDISISAIGQESSNLEIQDEAKNLTNNNNNNNNNRLRKAYGLGPGVTVNTGGNIIQRHNKQQQQQAQVLHQAGPIPKQRFNQPSLNQQQHAAVQAAAGRFIVNKDVLALTRMLRPANSKIPNPASNVGGGGIGRQGRAVPGAIQMSSLRGNNILHKYSKDGSIVVDSTSLRIDNSSTHYGNVGNQKAGSAIQVNQVVQSVQGAITLPGGTITVTPLAAGGGCSVMNINGDRSILKSSTATTTSNGLPMSSSSLMDNPAVTATPMKPGTKSSQLHSSRNKGIVNTGPRMEDVGGSMSQRIPLSVVSTVQGLQKSVSELIRVAAEQIAVDMIEHSTMKNESDRNYKVEHDKLVLKHIKELTELRHNHEILMRELRSNMENEKKRAVLEVRRQCELEKQKAVEEAKKKQWCALCGREALFYCCWNTSYCGYPCQEDHWPSHMSVCTQGGSNMNTR